VKKVPYEHFISTERSNVSYRRRSMYLNLYNSYVNSHVDYIWDTNHLVIIPMKMVKYGIEEDLHPEELDLDRI